MVDQIKALRISSCRMVPCVEVLRQVTCVDSEASLVIIVYKQSLLAK